MFTDNRHVVVSANVEDLQPTQQDDYKCFKMQFDYVRTCSYCSQRYALTDTLGIFCCKRGTRDHFDYETENIDNIDGFDIPYTFYLCLLSEGKLPPHLLPSRENSTAKITGLQRALGGVKYDATSNEPSVVRVQRYFLPDKANTTP